MTIYKPNGVPKKEGSGLPPPEVIVQSEKLLQPAVVGTNNPSQTTSPLATSLALYQARKRRSKMIMIFNILVALAVVAIGVIGGIALYKHLTQRMEEKVFRCGVRYLEENEPRDAVASSHQRMFEETIEVDRENYAFEKINVPEIEECQRATILHDFERNLTAVIDRDHRHCFVLPLNRTIVRPPRDILDLLIKLEDGYYLPDMEIVREEYRVVTPPVENLNRLGYHIWRECRVYNTYRLARINEPLAMSKRSVGGDFCYGSFALGSTSTKFLEFVQLSGCA